MAAQVMCPVSRVAFDHSSKSAILAPREQHMANNDHVTKADLKILQDAIKADLNEVRDELRNEMKAGSETLRDELIEGMRDIETKLLKAFYGFAESTQKRVSEGERTSSGLTERLGTLERRITDLEKKVNFPHAS